MHADESACHEAGSFECLCSILIQVFTLPRLLGEMWIQVSKCDDRINVEMFSWY